MIAAGREAEILSERGEKRKDEAKLRKRVTEEEERSEGRIISKLPKLSSFFTSTAVAEKPSAGEELSLTVCAAAQPPAPPVTLPRSLSTPQWLWLNQQ